MNRFSPQALEEIISRRIANTGETREQAREVITRVTDALNAGHIELEVFDKSGVVIGKRDKDGYHPNAHDPSRRGRS